MKKLPLWLKYLIALPIALVAISLGVFVFMPNALAQDALTINAPSQVRVPFAESNVQLLTLRVNNIQVRAEWDVEGSDSADFSVEGGTLVLVSEVTSSATKSAVVVVRDKFSVLNSSYTDLEAKATINIEFASMFILGGLAGLDESTQEDYRNDVWSSVNGKDWEPLDNADWDARSEYAAVYHSGSIFVMGGRDASKAFGDVWSSADGKEWNFVGNANWSARYGLRAVVHNGLIYVSGGNTNLTSPQNGALNDVWSSADGKSWAKKEDIKSLHNIPYERWGHEMVSLGNNMFIIAGQSDASASDYKRNIFSSSNNGNSWALLGDKWGPGGQRTDFYAITHDGQMYIMGGYRGTSLSPHTDVRSSSNGNDDWNPKTTAAGWGKRFGLGAASFGNRIYVIGGQVETSSRNNFSNRNDVWSSVDGGVNWTMVTGNADWEARFGHRIVVPTLP